jgi:hypothetical protein
MPFFDPVLVSFLSIQNHDKLLGTHWAIYKSKGKSGKHLGGICQEGLG